MFSELRWEVIVDIAYIDGIAISRKGTVYPSGALEFTPGA
jgi:hypothetical protein